MYHLDSISEYNYGAEGVRRCWFVFEVFVRLSIQGIKRMQGIQIVDILIPNELTKPLFRTKVPKKRVLSAFESIRGTRKVSPGPKSADSRD